MKKNILIQILILFTACDNKNTHISVESNLNVESSQTEMDKTKDSKIIEREFNLNYHPETNSYSTKLLKQEPFEYIIYFSTNQREIKDIMQVTIDSLVVIKPKYSILMHTDNLAMGGYINRNIKDKLSSYIMFLDVNNDGELDINIYNPLVSGSGQNRCFNVFLNNSNEFNYSESFSKSNLKYNKQTNTYSDQTYGGHGGHIYTKTEYTNENNLLMPIKIEWQDYNEEKDLYIRTIKNLKDNTIAIQEIKNER